MPPRTNMREFLDEDGDDDVPSSPTRRTTAATRKAAANAKARKEGAPAPPQEPPGRMPRLTRKRAAETGEQPIPGMQDADNHRRRPEPQGASPPTRSSSPNPPAAPPPRGRTLKRDSSRGRARTRGSAHAASHSRPPTSTATKSVHFKMRAHARHGRGGIRYTRPRSQVRVLDIEPEEGAEEDDDRFHDPSSPQSQQRHYVEPEVDYEYDPSWFEDDAALTGHEQDDHDDGRPGVRERSARFSAPDVRRTSAIRTRDDSRSRGTSISSIVVVASHPSIRTLRLRHGRLRSVGPRAPRHAVHPAVLVVGFRAATQPGPTGWRWACRSEDLT